MATNENLTTVEKGINIKWAAPNKNVTTGMRQIHILRFILIHSVVSNHSVSGQQRAWSDYSDAQADQGLRCPHMPKDVFVWRGHIW